MRFFDRDRFESPKIFESDAFEEQRGLIRELIFSSDEKMRAQRRMPYRPQLLKNAEVIAAIENVFGRVCAYCETPLGITEELTLDHYRPRSNAGDSDTRDGHLYYAWLSYEWANLLPVCPNCNKHKRNGFPIALGSRAALGADIEELRKQERPLLLDPCFDDVAEHLDFDADGLVRPKSSRGDATIDMLALNRAPLLSERSKRFRAMAGDLIERPEMYEAITTGYPGGWSSHVISFRKGTIGSAGGFSLALLKWFATNSQGSHRFETYTGAADRSFGGSSLLSEMLGLLTSLPVRDRRKLLGPFLEAENGPSVYSEVEQAKPAVRPTAKPSRNVSLADLPSARFPVNRVEIANFKALRSVTFTLPDQVDNPDLEPCMLILGENATGKSSVLEAISLALLGTAEITELDRILRTEDITPAEFVHRHDAEDWDRFSPDSLSVSLTFFGNETSAHLKADGEAEGFSGTQCPSKIMLAYGPRRFFTKRKSRRFRAPAYRVKSLFDPMEVIANPIDWLLKLKDESRFDAAVRALRVVLMLEPEAKVLREDGRILIDTPQGQTPLSKMSVGYKSIVALSVDIIREMFYHYDNLEEAYAVVVIDEIETHLHPRWKMRIVSLLREAFPRIQFVMTTHDPLCLRGMYQGEVFVLQRSSEDSRVESLEELPDVRGMRADQILTSEFFGLGSTDPETDAKVERHQFLVRKGTLTEAEEEERKRLVTEVERTMMVGDTLAEQTDAAAMAQAADIDEVPLVKLKDTARQRLIEEKLAWLQAE